MPRTKKQLVTLEEFDAGGAVLGDCKHIERHASGCCKACGDQVYTFDAWQDLRGKADELDMLFHGDDVDGIEKEFKRLANELSQLQSHLDIASDAYRFELDKMRQERAELLANKIAGWRKDVTEAVDARKADQEEHKKHIVALTDQLAIEHTAAALARKMAHGLVDIGSSAAK